MEPDKIKELIREAQRGNEASLNELIEVHTLRLQKYVRSELGNRLRQRLDSQDVMQQVYLDAFHHIRNFVDQGPDSFYAWLRRIVVNRICDEGRHAFLTEKRGGEVRVADLGGEVSMLNLLDQVSGSVTTPSKAADFADRVRLLNAALNQLSEDHCEVIRLRYLKQLNVAETAKKMDRSEQAIRSLCVRALLHLRQLLDNAI
ncbi:MAG: RNA polymerase sigma factor [Planctomycetota bacterium]